MDTIHLRQTGTKMIAHRGASGLECENSCPAFLFAAARSYYGIETDVHLTRDGVFVLCHDSNISRVTGGVDKVIEDSTYEELRQIPLVSPRYGERRTDLTLPLLEDYIAICRKYGKRAILEIKTPFTTEQCRALTDRIAALGYADGVTYISFHADALLHLREVCPGAEAQFLTGDATPSVLAFLDENRLDLDIQHGALTEAFAGEVHAHGHRINVWTVDDAERAQTLIDMGVDFITSNFLE